MDIQTAQFVLGGLAALLLGVWIAALVFTWQVVTRASSQGDLLPGDHIAHSPGERALSASASELPASAEVLAKKAARLLAQGKLGGLMRVAEATGSLVRFEAGLESWLQPVRRGEVHYRALGPDLTAAECSVVIRPPGVWMLWMAGLFLVLGLAAIGTAVVAVETYVVHDPDSMTRFQVFQVLQAIHLIWPPFLFCGLYRGQRSGQEAAARQLMDGLTHNLPYLD